ncbi:MAG: hypothetical protein ACLGIO_00390 [Acidimicrobiia bacterium]
MDQAAPRPRRARSRGGAGLAAVLLLVAALTWCGPTRPAHAAVQGRVRLVRQTSWLSPGDTLSLALRTADIADPAALELAVSVHPAVRTRAELARTIAGEGLTSPLGPRSSAAVPLPEVPAAVDGTLSVQVPTQGPEPSSDPARVRLRGPGIYPVNVELRELGGGDTVDRFTTHLLAVEEARDGSRLGTTVVLPLSAPPSTGLEGVTTGPPAGASAMADTAAGLTAAPRIPLTIAPTPEVRETLTGSNPTTAAALRSALSSRDVLGRPYVPVDVAALGAAAGPLLSRQLATGREVTTAVLGREPIRGIWLADEPLDGAALGQVVAAGASRLLLSQTALGRTGAAVPAPLQPVTLPTPSGSEATALVADATLAARLDGRGAAIDQPLVAHHLLADLAAVATLPPDQGGIAPGDLGRRVVTVVAGRGFTPSSGFLAELLGGLASSPVLQALDLAAAFAAPPEPPAPPPRSTTTSRSRRGTTTTTAAPRAGRTLAPLPADVATRAIGDVAGEALWQVSTHEQVLADPAPIDDGEPAQVGGGGRDPAPADLERRLLVATSADLPVDQRRARLKALAARAEADLAKVEVPADRTLRLTARTGQLPVGISNDTGRTARVLLQLESEKLDFPAGNSVPVVLDRRTNTQPISVRVRASGSFPVKVRLLTPDGGRVLQETEYIVRADTVPGVAIAVGGTAAVFLGIWWAKTLLPERRHLRRRHRRRTG